LIQQSELLKILKDEYDFSISRQAFSKKVQKGFIRAYYKEKSNRKFYKIDEVLAFLGADKKKEIDKDIEDEEFFTLESLLKECVTPLEKVRVERAYHRAEKKVLRYSKLLEEYTHKDYINKETKIISKLMENGVNKIIPKIKKILHDNNFKDDSFIPTIEETLINALNKNSKLNYKKIVKLEKARYD